MKGRLRLLVAIGGSVLLMAVLMVGLALAASFNIDTFDNGSMSLSAYWNAAHVVSGTTSATGILDGERDVYVEIIGADNSDDRVYVSVTPNTYSHSQDDGVTGYSVVTWDGPDGDPTSLDPVGLGGEDLTASGVYTGLDFLQISGDLGAFVVITVTTDATNYSTYMLSTVAGNYVGYFIPFVDFTAAGGTGADFTNVGSIALKVDGTSVSSYDMSFDFFEAGEIDLGDLPPTYAMTLLSDNGANHIVNDLYLGASVDSELDGDETIAADGDDTNDGSDDEDGVLRATLPWTNGLTFLGHGGSVNVTVNMTGCVSGWVDWTGDNDFDDTGMNADGIPLANDQIINMAYVTSGTHNFTFHIPDGTFPGSGGNVFLYARFRVMPDFDDDGDCGDETALAVTGTVYNGEVEDYRWEFTPTAVVISDLDARSPAYQWAAVAVGAASLVGIGGALLLLRRRRVL